MFPITIPLLVREPNSLLVQAQSHDHHLFLREVMIIFFIGTWSSVAEPGFETWVFPLPSHKKIESIGLKYLGSKAERLFFLLFWARLSGNAIQNVVLYIYTYKYILIYTLRCPKIVGYSREYKGIPLNPPMVGGLGLLVRCIYICIAAWIREVLHACLHR